MASVSFLATKTDATSQSESLPDIVIDTLRKTLPAPFRFAILRLGKDCNAYGSNSFTEAKCSASGIFEEKELLVRDFNKVFKRGIDLINKLKSGEINTFDHMEKHNQAAFVVLAQFLKEKELHEKSLNNVFNRKQNDRDDKLKSSRETEVTVALAEHLLGRLAPGQSYMIDFKSKGKGRCSCGEEHCQKEPTYGRTGIGHEEVWHGHVDIMLSSHEGIEPDGIACAVKHIATDSESGFLTPVKKMKMDDNKEMGVQDHDDDDEETEDESDGSPGGRSIVEVKQSIIGAEDQSVAETIVFSLLQKIRHPGFKNHLIPNILISSKEFRILMYDAENDVFLYSVHLPIFHDDSQSLLNAAVLILWMVLHYRIFCSGLDVDPEKIEKVQCKFRDIVGEKWEIYSKSLKSGIARFPVVKKNTLPSDDYIWSGTEMF